jgi:hypothetical protein
LRDCDRKLNRYRKLLETGNDPSLVGQWITEVQAERTKAEATLRHLTRATTADLTTASEVRDVVEAVDGLVGLLSLSQPKLRGRFYEEAGFSGTYDPDTKSVEASADIGVRMVRVGGATSTRSTRGPWTTWLSPT